MNRIDITEPLHTAFECSALWSVTHASIAAWIYANAHHLRTDWDPAAGESWICFVRGDAVCAYLGVSLPLVMTVPDMGSWPYPIQAIEIADLNETPLECLPEFLATVFGDTMVLGRPGFDPISFTAQDLWYATV